MDIFFKTRKLARVCNSDRELRKRYGDRMAKTIAMRLAVLKHARTLSLVPTTPPERRHRLAGKRKEQYAVDLVHPHRLVFEPHRSSGAPADAAKGDAGGVTAITIIEIIDYH